MLAYMKNPEMLKPSGNPEEDELKRIAYVQHESKVRDCKRMLNIIGYRKRLSESRRIKKGDSLERSTRREVDPTLTESSTRVNVAVVHVDKSDIPVSLRLFG